MGYVPVDQSVTNHAKTFRLARLLGEHRCLVVGRLVALWNWAADSALDGILLDADADMLASIMLYDGKPAELLDALLSAGFLDLGDDGLVRIHNWDLHMGPLIARRGAQRLASANYRAKQKDQPNASVLRPVQADVDDHVTLGHDGQHSPHVDVNITSTSRDVDAQHHVNCRVSRVEKNTLTTGSDTPLKGEGEKYAREGTAGAVALSHSQTSKPSSLARRMDVVQPSPVGGRAVALAADTAAGDAAVAAALTSAPTPETSPAQPKRQRAADPLWDACVAAIGHSPSNDIKRGVWNKGLKSLRQSRASPDEITERCERYRERFGGDIPLHPVVLAKHWTELAYVAQEITPYGTTTSGRSAQFAASAFTGATRTARSSRSAPLDRGVPSGGVSLTIGRSTRDPRQGGYGAQAARANVSGSGGGQKTWAKRVAESQAWGSPESVAAAADEKAAANHYRQG
jgi:hypothetical protein